MAESTINGQEFSERLIQIIEANLKNIFDPIMLKSIGILPIYILKIKKLHEIPDPFKYNSFV